VSGFEALLIGRNRCNICVGGFVRDEPDFCLAHGDMSWVYGSDRAHLSLSLSLLEFLQKLQLLVHVFLRHSVNVGKKTTVTKLAELLVE